MVKEKDYKHYYHTLKLFLVKLNDKELKTNIHSWHFIKITIKMVLHPRVFLCLISIIERFQNNLRVGGKKWSRGFVLTLLFFFSWYYFLSFVIQSVNKMEALVISFRPHTSYLRLRHGDHWAINNCISPRRIRSGFGIQSTPTGFHLSSSWLNDAWFHIIHFTANNAHRTDRL